MPESWLEGMDQVDSARLVDLLERLHKEGVEVTPELAAEELSRLGDQRSREGLYAAALKHFSMESGKKVELGFQPRFSEVCRFEPATFSLGPSASALATLDFESGFPAGDRRELLVDVRADGVLRMKLWVEVRIDPQ